MLASISRHPCLKSQIPSIAIRQLDQVVSLNSINEMATTAAGSLPAITTVAGSARACSESFQNCLNKAAQIHHRELSLVEDQHARFAIWAANIRVFSAGRDSLDHRLREASDVQDAVVGLLQALDYKVQSCE